MKSMCERFAAAVAAMVAVCAIASASASASTPQWYVGGKALSGSSKLSSTVKMEENIVFSIPSLDRQVTCTAMSETGAEIISPSTAKMSGLKFNGCKVTEGPKSCEIEGEEGEATKSEVAMSIGTAPEDKAAVKEAGIPISFFFINCSGIEGREAFSGTWSLGVQKGQEELTEQTFVGQGTKSGLSYAGNPVNVTGKFKLKLESGAKWSYQGTEEKEKTGSWYVGAKLLSGSSKLSNTIKVEETVVFAIPGLGFKMACTAIEDEGAEIASPSAATFKELRLTGCKVTEGPKGCEVEGGEVYIFNKTEMGMSLGTSPEDKAAVKSTDPIEFSLWKCGGIEGLKTIADTWALGVQKGQEELTEQTFVGQGTKSGLSYEGNPVNVTGKFKLKLESGAKWSFH